MLYSSLSSSFSFGRSAAYLSTRRWRSRTGCIPHSDAKRYGLVGTELEKNKDDHVTFVSKNDSPKILRTLPFFSPSTLKILNIHFLLHDLSLSSFAPPQR